MDVSRGLNLARRAVVRAASVGTFKGNCNIKKIKRMRRNVGPRYFQTHDYHFLAHLFVRDGWIRSCSGVQGILNAIEEGGEN